MLSAIIQRLRVIRLDKRAEHRRSLISLAASAFPDLRPWQLRAALLSNEDEKNEAEGLSELYYEYLSLLLHPLHGNGKARRDASLIQVRLTKYLRLRWQVSHLLFVYQLQEWCKLSVDVNVDTVKSGTEDKRKKNFFAVASRSSSSHLNYYRDLPFLLDLSMQARESNLALDIGKYMISVGGW